MKKAKGSMSARDQGRKITDKLIILMLRPDFCVTLPVTKVLTLEIQTLP